MTPPTTHLRFKRLGLGAFSIYWFEWLIWTVSCTALSSLAPHPPLLMFASVEIQKTDAKCWRMKWRTAKHLAHGGWSDHCSCHFEVGEISGRDSLSISYDDTSKFTKGYFATLTVQSRIPDIMTETERMNSKFPHRLDCVVDSAVVAAVE